MVNEIKKQGKVEGKIFTTEIKRSCENCIMASPILRNGKICCIYCIVSKFANPYQRKVEFKDFEKVASNCDEYKLGEEHLKLIKKLKDENEKEEINEKDLLNFLLEISPFQTIDVKKALKLYNKYNKGWRRLAYEYKKYLSETVVDKGKDVDIYYIAYMSIFNEVATIINKITGYDMRCKGYPVYREGICSAVDYEIEEEEKFEDILKNLPKEKIKELIEVDSGNVYKFLYDELDINLLDYI